MMEMMKSVSHEEEMLGRDRKISEHEEQIAFLRSKVDASVKEKEELVMALNNTRITVRELERQLRGDDDIDDVDGDSVDSASKKGKQKAPLVGSPLRRRLRWERWAREKAEAEAEADVDESELKKEVRLLFNQLKETEAEVRDNEAKLAAVVAELEATRARVEIAERRERMRAEEEDDDQILEHELEKEEKMRREAEIRRLHTELEDVRRELFFSTAVAIKLNLSQVHFHTHIPLCRDVCVVSCVVCHVCRAN
jgi:hypothetical protein